MTLQSPEAQRKDWGHISINHPLPTTNKQQSPHIGIQEFEGAASPSQPPTSMSSVSAGHRTLGSWTFPDLI